eukprot:336704_1
MNKLEEIKTNLLDHDETQPIQLLTSYPINVTHIQKRSSIVDVQYNTSIKQQISNQIKQEIQWWLKIGAFSYSKNFSNTFMTIFVFLFLSINISLWAITMPGNGYCWLLDICVLTFQIESLFLYVFAYKYINSSFINQVIESLTNIDINNEALNKIIKEYQKQNNTAISNEETMTFDAKRIHERVKNLFPKNGIKIFQKQLKYCILLIIPAYLTGYIIVFEENQSNSFWYYYVFVENALDFIRFIPQVLHIALVRSFYVTFNVELDKFRHKYNVLSRINMHEKTSENNGNQLLTNITCNDFITDFEGLIKKYRRLSKRLAAWIAIYLLFNTISFIFFALATLSALVNGPCNHTFDYYYYSHYLIELATFFVGWVFLVLPFCENHRLLSRFVRDFQCVNKIENVNERIAIHLYLESILEASPFSIYGTKATYSKFFWVLDIVFLTIGLNVVSKLSAIG